MFLSNRSGGPDAALVQLAAGRALALGEDRALGDVAFPASFLMEPLLAPEAASLEESVTAALESGFDVLLTADNTAGEPPERCRFRLEAFQAAARAGMSMIPAWIEPAESSLVKFGQSVDVSDDPYAARKKLRQLLAALNSAEPRTASRPQ